MGSSITGLQQEGVKAQHRLRCQQEGIATGNDAPLLHPIQAITVQGECRYHG